MEHIPTEVHKKYDVQIGIVKQQIIICEESVEERSQLLQLAVKQLNRRREWLKAFQTDNFTSVEQMRSVVEYENLKDTVLTLFKGKDYGYAISILESVIKRLENDMKDEIIL